MHYQLHLVVLLLLLVLLVRLCFGACLPVKAETGRKLVALATLALMFHVNRRRLQFFVRHGS
jgi:hypothetical protein